MEFEIEESVNVFGEPLIACSNDPLTGFYRNGCCDTGPDDTGVHTICTVVTDEFLEFSKSVGNDLSTPYPQFGFKGLKAGDKWCLCASRWQQAFEAGKAPLVVLEATHEESLKYASMEDLVKSAYKTPTTKN
jgi:uncharacterized protein (DUF2237 family)